MEPENNQIESRFDSLHKVTSLSKYLALALFIIMPFIGGWIGYTYAPEKVVEVESVVMPETSVSQEEKVDIVLTNQKPETYDNSESGELDEYIDVEEIKLDHNMFNPHQFSVPLGRRWSEFQYPSVPLFGTIERCLNQQNIGVLVTVSISVTTT